MKKINCKKLRKSFSLSMALLVAFFANDWFKQAYSQPNEFVKWIMIILSFLVLTGVVFFALDEDGNL